MKSIERFTPFQIFRAGLNDVAAFVPLFEQWRRYYGKTANAGEAAAFLSDRLRNKECVIYIARDRRAEALGYVLIYNLYSSLELSRTVVLNDMFVREEARRHGIGRALLEHAQMYAISTGARRIDVSIKPDNVPALALYESLGFSHDGFRYLSLELDPTRPRTEKPAP